jgi:mono/diheme cytochrome c family protein
MNFTNGFAVFAIAAAASLGSAACDQPPDASTIWGPQDHDKQEQANMQQQGLQQAPHPIPSGAKGAQLVEIVWMQSCAVCHGPRGQGDGPNGAMVKAPDLTSAEWQAKVKDDEMEQAIRNGKGQMPKFDMPDSTLKGLVARIRALRAAQ